MQYVGGWLNAAGTDDTADELWSDKLDPDLGLCPNLMLCHSPGQRVGWDSSLYNVDALSRPQTMRRQRTEVVVELRKVRTFVLSTSNTYYLFFLAHIELMYWKMLSFFPHEFLLVHTETDHSVPSTTEQKRWAPSEEEKRAPRGHLWGLWCWRRFQIGTLGCLSLRSRPCMCAHIRMTYFRLTMSQKVGRSRIPPSLKGAQHWVALLV